MSQLHYKITMELHGWTEGGQLDVKHAEDIARYAVARLADATGLVAVCDLCRVDQSALAHSRAEFVRLRQEKMHAPHKETA